MEDDEARETSVTPAEEVEVAGPEIEQSVKVDLLLKATGDAPIMKKKKWTVDPEKTVSWVIQFIRKYLKLEPSESLFLYVNQAFAPPPDQVIKNLYSCFGSDGKLVLYYARTQAWG
ncbi:Autophagy protein 12-like [Halotydeus destructor]|nr:Autophagy protein 12-like [Halotydeus destructor]